MIILFNHAPILWISWKQLCIATSTTESEYIVACLAGKEIVWLRHLLSHLDVLSIGPTSLRSNNKFAIRSVHNPEYYKRMKHIDIIFHKIREL